MIFCWRNLGGFLGFVGFWVLGFVGFRGLGPRSRSCLEVFFVFCFFLRNCVGVSGLGSRGLGVSVFLCGTWEFFWVLLGFAGFWVLLGFAVLFWRNLGG